MRGRCGEGEVGSSCIKLDQFGSIWIELEGAICSESQVDEELMMVETS